MPADGSSSVESVSIKLYDEAGNYVATVEDTGDLGGIKWQAHAKIEKFSPEQTSRAAELHGVAEKDLLHHHLYALNEEPDHGVVEVPGNLLTTAGLQRITNLIIGSGASAFTAAQSVVGVGDRGGSASNTAAITDTDLTAAASTSNRYLQATDSAPTAVNGVLTAVSTFASGNANFAWNEWCWIISTGTITPGGVAIDSTHPGSTGNQMINHKTPSSSLGTKASGATWVFTSSVTLSQVAFVHSSCYTVITQVY